MMYVLMYASVALTNFSFLKLSLSFISHKDSAKFSTLEVAKLEQPYTWNHKG